MKNKVMAVVLAAGLGTALLAGCGSSSSSGSSAADTTASASNAQADASSADTQSDAAQADTAAAEAGTETAAASGKEYKVGIVQYMDHASLNQITDSAEKELDAKGQELGVTFDYSDYFFNGEGDATTLNQIAAQLKSDGVDAVIAIATPAAQIVQSTYEGDDTPIIFSAVTDPVGAGLVKSMDAPGANITGTSDALNTEAIMNLIFAENPDAKSVGLLYSKSEDASAKAIQEAKDFLDKKGVKYVEKTGTSTDEVSQAADALIASGVDAVFTPTDNTIMNAELAIYEKFIKAGIPHYTGADSFALNGAFLGFGINYKDLGKSTADITADVLVNGKNPATYPVVTFDNGIATINTDTAKALGIDLTKAEEAFKPYCSDIEETTTAENFSN